MHDVAIDGNRALIDQKMDLQRQEDLGFALVVGYAQDSSSTQAVNIARFVDATGRQKPLQLFQIAGTNIANAIRLAHPGTDIAFGETVVFVSGTNATVIGLR